MSDPQGPIIAAWESGAQARDALALAASLARQVGARVRVVHVGPIHVGLPEFAPAMQLEAEDELAEAPVELLEGVEFDRMLVPGRSAAEGLHRAIDECDAQLVVIGSTHRGPIGRVIPGTVADHLLHGSPCAVAIAPHGYADAGDTGPLRVIAAAYDGSPESRAAVSYARDAALREEATVRVISVAVVPALVPELRGGLDETVRSLPPEVRADGRLLNGDAAAQILEECEKGVDLLVIGSRGYGVIGRVMLGSVSSEVIRSAPCAVVVVPSSARRHEGDVPASSGREFVV